MTEMNASANFSQFSTDLKNAFIAQSKCKPVYHRDGSISVSSIFRPESDSPKLRLYPSNVSHDIVTGISYSPGQNAAAAGVDLPSFTPAKRKLYAEARAERQRLHEREQARHGLIQQAEYLIAYSLTDITDIDEYTKAFDFELDSFIDSIDDRAIDQFIAKQKRVDYPVQEAPAAEPKEHLTDSVRLQARQAMLRLAESTIAKSLAPMKSMPEYQDVFDEQLAWYENSIDDRAIDQFIAKQKREEAAINHAIQAAPDAKSRLTDGTRRALFAICDNAKEVYFFEVARHASLPHSFTIQQLATATDMPLSTVSAYVKKAFWLEATGQKRGKADLYRFVSKRQLDGFVRRQAIQLVADKTRDQHNQSKSKARRLYDELHPESPEKPILSKVLKLVAYQTRKQVSYMQAHLNESHSSPLPLSTGFETYIVEWCRSQQAEGGHYHYEREHLTGLSRDAIRHQMSKAGFHYREAPHMAKPVRVKMTRGAGKSRRRLTAAEAKREAVAAMQQADPSVLYASSSGDDGGDYMDFKPVARRTIVKTGISLRANQPPRPENARISRIRTQRMTKRKIEVLSKEQLEYALPAWPRRSITWSKDKADAYDLWQLIIAKLHAGKAILIERGKHKILTDMNGVWVKPNIDTVRALEEKPPPPDG